MTEWTLLTPSKHAKRIGNGIEIGLVRRSGHCFPRVSFAAEIAKVLGLTAGVRVHVWEADGRIAVEANDGGHFVVVSANARSHTGNVFISLPRLERLKDEPAKAATRFNIVGRRVEIAIPDALLAQATKAAKNITENTPELPTVREERTVEPEPVVAKIATTEPEPADAPLADAEAPDAPWVEEEPKNGKKLPGQQFRRKGEEAPRPKPVTAGWSTERDPNLVREPEVKELRELPKGSSSQQLADRIEAELPELMRLHFHGPIIADLVAHYDEPEARIVGAVRYLVSKRKVRLINIDGQQAQHVVPWDLEVPNERPADRSGTADAKGRRVLAALREKAEDGFVRISQGAISDATGIPLGSITYHLTRLIDSGQIALVDKGNPRAKQPAQYRVTA